MSAATTPTYAELANRYGLPLVGTWLGSMFYAQFLAQVTKYFSRVQQDKWWRSALAVTTILLATMGLVSSYMFIYVQTVRYWGNPVSAREPISLVTSCMSIAVNGVMFIVVDAFLLVRYRALSRNWYMTACLSALVLTAFGGMIYDVYLLANLTSVSNKLLQNVHVAASIWLSFTAGADVLIAAALLRELSTMKTSFPTTQSLLSRLIRQTIQTGAATSICAIIILASYLINNRSSVSTALLPILEQLYAITMMSNLQLRSHKDSGSSRSRSRTTNTIDRTHHRAIGSQGPFADVDGGIHVHRTAVVQVDHMDSKAPGRGLRSSPGNQVYAMDSLGEDKFIVGEDGESFNSNAHSGLKGNVGRLV